MRMMLKVALPVEKSNQALKSGQLPKILMGAMQDLKPEAAYFFPENGKRASIMVFDMKDTSQIPVIAERFFVELDAEVSFIPVMNADDLMKGLEAQMAVKATA